MALTNEARLALVVQAAREKPWRVHPGLREPGLFAAIGKSVELQKADLVACSESFTHTLSGWFYTEDPHDKAHPHKKFPAIDYLMLLAWVLSAQDADLKPLFPRVLVIKSRQMKISWLCISHLLHDAMFNDGRAEVVQSSKAKESDRLMQRSHKATCPRLPPHLAGLFRFNPDHRSAGQPALGKKQRCLLKVEKTYALAGKPAPYSEIIGLPGGVDAIQHETGSIVLEDEFQKQPKADHIVEAAQPAITGGGQIILVGTVPDERNVSWEGMARIPDSALSQEVMPGVQVWINGDGFLCFQVHYTADPDKCPGTEAGDLWLEEARQGISEDGWQRQYEINWGVRASGVKFPEFARQRASYIGYCEYDPQLPLLCGWDFGFSPSHSVAIFAQLHVNEERHCLHVLRTISAAQEYTEKFIPRIIAERSMLYPEGIWHDFPDAEEMKSTHLGSALDIMIRWGINPNCLYMLDTAQAGMMHWLLCLTAKGESKIRIDPRYNGGLIDALDTGIVCKGDDKTGGDHPAIDFYKAFNYMAGQLYYDFKPMEIYFRLQARTDDDEYDDDRDDEEASTY